LSNIGALVIKESRTAAATDEALLSGKSLSPVPIHREGLLDTGAPQEFALPTLGRN